MFETTTLLRSVAKRIAPSMPSPRFRAKRKDAPKQSPAPTVETTGTRSGSPEKTAAVFVQNPLRPQIPEIIYKTGDLGEYNKRGELMFLGRRDSQIKRSGYRIELGEIECALQNAPGIELCCCYYDADKEKIIAAYTGNPDEKALKAALKAVLPKYMLPDVLLKQETLPRTGSGKIDRLALRQEVENEHLIP